MPAPTVKVAAVQAAPVFLDTEASLAKALALIEQAADGGVRLLVFPEAFLPAWPAWVDEVLPGEDEAWHLRLLELVMGANEREEHGGTVYNTILYFDDGGRLLGKHRKLVPTHAERLVWGMGDGSDLAVHQTAVGRVGGLICWENSMPWPASPSTPRASTSGSRRPWPPTSPGWPPFSEVPRACPTGPGCSGGSSPTATGCWTATR
jgi:predicted amidohydrolase